MIDLSYFRIEGPAAVQCSFGRTSGYLLWLILQAHGGRLPPDVHVMFENTGKEASETLAFGHELSRRWGVSITWLEYERHYLPIYKSDDRRVAGERARLFCGHVYEEAAGRKEAGFRVTDYQRAWRALPQFDRPLRVAEPEHAPVHGRDEDPRGEEVHDVDRLR